MVFGNFKYSIIFAYLFWEKYSSIKYHNKICLLEWQFPWLTKFIQKIIISSAILLWKYQARCPEDSVEGRTEMISKKST